MPPITFQSADVRSADGELHLDPVRFCVRTDTAYALDTDGHRVWEAIITGVDRVNRDTVVVHLADGPDVTAHKYCRPCKQRSGAR